jgi:hypothetical protein
VAGGSDREAIRELLRRAAVHVSDKERIQLDDFPDGMALRFERIGFGNEPPIILLEVHHAPALLLQAVAAASGTIAAAFRVFERPRRFIEARPSRLLGVRVIH